MEVQINLLWRINSYSKKRQKYVNYCVLIQQNYQDAERSNRPAEKMKKCKRNRRNILVAKILLRPIHFSLAISYSPQQDQFIFELPRIPYERENDCPPLDCLHWALIQLG